MTSIVFNFLAITAIYILMSWSFYLPYRVGQLHFMTVANMTISGYFGAYAALNWNWPFLIVFLVGIILGALIGFLVSLAIGDAPCFAVVIVGFTFIFITKTIVENVDAFGGTLGMFGIPRIAETGGTSRLLLFFVAYAFILIVGFFIYRFDHSRLGRAASAIFVDKDLATSFGVNVKRMGMGLQTWASALGGASGVLYAYIMRNLFPDFFTFHLVGVCMTMLFVGGYATQWGVVLAAPVLWGVPLLFPSAIQSWRIVIYGVLLLVVLVLKPEGVITRPFVYNTEKFLSLKILRRKKLIKTHT
ncbi:MAG: branched-chain amino acid ABC transporter permease [Spirochaetia bacterium]